MSRLIVVSNRVAIPDGSVQSGGLATGVLAALRQSAGGMWFGWSGKTHASPDPAPQVIEKDGIRFATIDLEERHFDGYYNGFCNGSLWPLHHYFPGAFRYDEAEYAAYLAVNLYFAKALLPLLENDDVLWIHDYQLIPLGRMLRHLGVKSRIGFFLHIPYPHIAMLRLLPTYPELVKDLNHYDLVGFQTSEDRDALFSAMKGVLGTEAVLTDEGVSTSSRSTRIGVFPIGVDVDVIALQAETAVRDEPRVQQLMQSLDGRQLLLGVDRLDYSKGLVERFSSYRALLETCPDLQGKITLVQIAPLSRTDVTAYMEIRDALERATGHTNGQYADIDWTPIRYLNKDFSHATLSGFLRIADVGVVTPIRDGMNLVAKEYVAAQDPADPGVLVLSTLAGAAHELLGALLVNPYDRNAVARAFNQALAMPLEERRARHARNLDALRANSIEHWHEGFMAALLA